MEITGILRNASRVPRGGDVRAPCLRGQVYGDTRGRLGDGEWITTSTVMSEESDVFTTRYSVYKVESWADAPVAANDNYPTLRTANQARQIEWDAGNQLTLAYRGNELAGEVGEACNVIKKIERERLGIAGSRDTIDHLAEELADVIICADLIAISAGIDLDAAVIAKFNATSEKVGLRTRLVAA
jgi:NTP pyrophosphatase (non-canonical NTP hydrolase)